MAWARKHKFNAIATTYNGKKYPSKLEAAYAKRLEKLKESGEIVFYLEQVPLTLEASVRYVIDFVEFWADGEIKFVEVKGKDLPMGILKRKQAEARYPFKIEVVRKV